LGDNPSRLSVSKALLERAQVGDYELYASTFVYAEVGGNQLIREGQVKDSSAATGTVSDFFEQRLIRYVDVDFLVAQAAVKISREHGLRGPDAVHLASAIRARCDVFMTWNSKDFGRLYGNRVDGVLLREPHLWGQGVVGENV